uniref:persulfide dioxygenase n=1 Tax=Haptolina brevifila TaxID=156173 RepID=A0A7S2GQ89_9EUKA
MALIGLPEDKSKTLVLTCRSGKRAAMAAEYLGAQGYINILNGGGPKGDPKLWEALTKSKGEQKYQLGLRGGSFVQLFDGEDSGASSTLTYILADEATREAIIIDPCIEHVDRDLAEVEKLGCKLVLALNTHAHADHITGTGLLKKKIAGLRSMIAKASCAKADDHLVDGQTVSWAGGTRSLTVLSTPGHTNGCLSFYESELDAVFTGDTLLIGGCGRTDFQEGSSENLYDSVHNKLFTLPPKTLVYPAHDYKGRRCSTIGEEMRSNPRLTRTKQEFVELMAGLNLPYPKKIDVSLPANLLCGIQD